MTFNVILLISLVYVSYLVLAVYDTDIKKYLGCKRRAKEIIDYILMHEYEFKTKGYMRFEIFHSDIAKLVDKSIEKKKLTYTSCLSVVNNETLTIVIKEK